MTADSGNIIGGEIGRNKQRPHEAGLRRLSPRNIIRGQNGRTEMDMFTLFTFAASLVAACVLRALIRRVFACVAWIVNAVLSIICAAALIMGGYDLPSMQAPAAPKRKRGRPRKQQASEPAPVLPAAPAPAPAKPARKAKPAPVEAAPAPAPAPRCLVRGNNAFHDELVAFTGTLQGWKRRDAIQAVIDNGGQAFETMPAGVTMLVVGDEPGLDKLNKANRWGVRIVTERDFEELLNQPLILTPEQFAAIYAA